jgi:hypothetical protein
MRQGFLFLFLGLLLGLAIVGLPHPSRWLAARLTALLISFGLVLYGMRGAATQGAVTRA